MKIWQLIVLEISLILMITILVIYLLSSFRPKNRRYEDIDPIMNQRRKRYDERKRSNSRVKNYPGLRK
jgi:hypothetical protein